MTVYSVVRIGGFLIWFWKRYIKGYKKARLSDEIDDQSWKVWVVGALAIALFIFINMVIVATYY
ncbi:MAG: hypothetical protein ACRCZQ_06595 [Bacteroidales bacterium]